MIIQSKKMTVSNIKGVVASVTAPLNPADKQLWLDTSVTPANLKSWDKNVQTWVSHMVQADLSNEQKQDIINNVTGELSSGNILRNTNLFYQMDFWANEGVNVTGLTRSIISIEDGYYAINQAFNIKGSGTAWNPFGFKQDFATIVNKKYMASIYCRRKTATTSNTLILTVGNQSITYNPNTEWQLVSLPFTATTNIATFSIGVTGTITDADIDIIAMQVETGSIVNPWGLAKEDIQSLTNDVVFLQEMTTPERIKETVLLSEEYIGAFSEVPSYADISGLATGEEVAGNLDLAKQYADDKYNEMDASVSELISSIEQSNQDIRMQFQMSQGVNLIRNSTGFFGTENWTVSGAVQTVANAELEKKAIGSAFYSTSAYTLTQEIVVEPDTDYSFSFWMKKEKTGNALIRLFDGAIETHIIGPEYTDIISEFTSPYIVNFKTREDQSTLTIKIDVEANTEAYFSGLMLNYGAVALQWSSHNEEVANTNIQFNLNGIKVKGLDNSYTIMSPEEFAGYAQVINDNGQASEQRIFTLNGENTEVYKLEVEKSIQLGMGAFVVIDNTEKTGIALFM